MAAPATALNPQDRGMVPGFWKDAALVLIGMTVALVGMWATNVRNSVSREDVSQMIEGQGPYVKERSGIEQRLTGIERGVARIETEIQKQNVRR